MREVAGSIERPADSKIEMEADAAGTWIRIPPPRLPWPIYLGAGVALASFVAVVAAGTMVFLFRLPFPGYETIVGGRFAPQPPAWRLAGLLGWLLIAPAISILTFASLRPLWRHEAVFIPRRSNSPSQNTGAYPVLLKSWELGYSRQITIEVADILRFELHRDPQELVESEIVIETQSALNQGRRARRRTIANSASEAEREWLASALNALLFEARRI